MLKIKLNNKEYKVESITAKALKRVMKFKKRYEILQAQGEEQEGMIDAMIEFIVDNFDGQFSEEELLDYLPLQELKPTFEYILTTIMDIFDTDDTKKK